MDHGGPRCAGRSVAAHRPAAGHLAALCAAVWYALAASLPWADPASAAPAPCVPRRIDVCQPFSSPDTTCSSSWWTRSFCNNTASWCVAAASCRGVRTGVSLVSSTRVQKKTFADVATIDDLYAWMLGPFFAYVVRPWCLLTTAMRVAMPSPDAHGRWCCHAAATGRCTRRRL